MIVSGPGANPTIYNATSTYIGSLKRFGSKIIFSYFEKRSILLQRWRCSCINISCRIDLWRQGTKQTFKTALSKCRRTNCRHNLQQHGSIVWNLDCSSSGGNNPLSTIIICEKVSPRPKEYYTKDTITNSIHATQCICSLIIEVDWGRFLITKFAPGLNSWSRIPEKEISYPVLKLCAYKVHTQRIKFLPWCVPSFTQASKRRHPNCQPSYVGMSTSMLSPSKRRHHYYTQTKANLTWS
jgi:hypothetical protein